ncbi:hypothetical protein [Galbibacter pacificus]|uniref:Uncharacterized protein n=1 Tax=Galbibacter pacificus TaxID=2996052 RepID=A0ABT6FQS3_9FLAO|nr:hypothetical protein [Galbibacter pacificus]MDG3582054.1 hypothetical protein [Galbibacter pacificus]MDG3585472.1 hypothetical protein [Galbibacter pacificus]
MATTLLIKAEDLTKGTPLGGNIDVSKYLHVIKEVQVFVIEPILGTKLYKKILSDYLSNALDNDYKALYEDYIKPIIIYSVAAEYVIIASYNVANGGIFKHQPENGEAVNKSEVDYLAQNQRNKADAYIKRLQKFLCTVNLPEYTTAQEENYDITPDRSFRYTGGWNL